MTYGVDYTVNNGQVNLVSPPADGMQVRIYRETPSDSLVDWTDASSLRALELDLSQLQQLHLIEEAQDRLTTGTLYFDATSGTYSALGYRVIDVADPVHDQDVVTKGFMENVQGNFVQANTALKDETTRQADSARESAENAKSSETDARLYMNTTKGYMDTTKGYMDVTKGYMNSAKDYMDVANNASTKASASESASYKNSLASSTSANTAQTYATQAGNSATTATNKATEAHSYVVLAKEYADKAKASEDKIASGQIQADWNEEDPNSKAYIRNAPTFVVVSARVRGEDEPSYGLVESSLLLNDPTDEQSSTLSVNVEGVDYPISNDFNVKESDV